MKVYVVTTGCYSDYSIDKIFTDRQKAENYKEWTYDANEIEEYDTEDNLVFEKFYKVEVRYTEHMMSYDNTEPKVAITKCQHVDKYETPPCYFSLNRWSNNYLFDLTMIRFVPAQNWNEEFYVNKYKKAMYDYLAIVKQRMLEGCSEKDIQMLLEGCKYEV